MENDVSIQEAIAGIEKVIETSRRNELSCERIGLSVLSLVETAQDLDPDDWTVAELAEHYGDIVSGLGDIIVRLISENRQVCESTQRHMRTTADALKNF